MSAVRRHLSVVRFRCPEEAFTLLFQRTTDEGQRTFSVEEIFSPTAVGLAEHAHELAAGVEREGARRPSG